MIKLKKIQSADFLACKGAVWTVVGHEDIRVHQIGNTWLADKYIDGVYVGKIASSSTRSLLIEKLSVAIQVENEWV